MLIEWSGTMNLPIGIGGLLTALWLVLVLLGVIPAGA